MNTSYSFLSHTDSGYCITCEGRLEGPFDFCRNCWPIYKDIQEADWLKVLRANASKRRRQRKKDEIVGLISLDRLLDKSTIEREL